MAEERARRMKGLSWVVVWWPTAARKRSAISVKGEEAGPLHAPSQCWRLEGSRFG